MKKFRLIFSTPYFLLSETSLITTELAPIKQFFPILTFSFIIDPAPIYVQSPILHFQNYYKGAIVTSSQFHINDEFRITLNLHPTPKVTKGYIFTKS